MVHDQDTNRLWFARATRAIEMSMQQHVQHSYVMWKYARRLYEQYLSDVVIKFDNSGHYVDRDYIYTIHVSFVKKRKIPIYVTIYRKPCYPLSNREFFYMKYLPEEIRDLILSYLTPWDLVSVAKTNQLLLNYYRWKYRFFDLSVQLGFVFRDKCSLSLRDQPYDGKM